jgi:hypothetical protein
MLCALSSVGSEAQAKRAHAAADRLADRGVRRPAWFKRLDAVRPEAAELICDAAFDEAAGVIVEFAGAQAEAHTLGAYFDNNLGGLVKDVLVAGPLPEVRERLMRHPHGVPVTLRKLELDEARARVQVAREVLDNARDPPVDDDVGILRALVDARLRLLPDGLQRSPHTLSGPAEHDGRASDR